MPVYSVYIFKYILLLK